jgi:hypothetical protein
VRLVLSRRELHLWGGFFKAPFLFSQIAASSIRRFPALKLCSNFSAFSQID